MNSSDDGLFRCTDLICQTYQPGFFTHWWNDIKRKHMPRNDVFFPSGQFKIIFCILKRTSCMDKTVKSVSRIFFMPVIQKIIVQQCAANERTQICPYPQKTAEPHAHHRYGKRMIVYTHTAVLIKAALKLHSVWGKYIAAVQADRYLGAFVFSHKFSPRAARVIQGRIQRDADNKIRQQINFKIAEINAWRVPVIYNIIVIQINYNIDMQPRQGHTADEMWIIPHFHFDRSLLYILSCFCIKIKHICTYRVIYRIRIFSKQHQPDGKRN